MVDTIYSDIFISARFNRCPVELKKKSEEDEQWERHLMSGGLCSLLGQTVCASHAIFLWVYCNTTLILSCNCMFAPIFYSDIFISADGLFVSS